MKELFKVKFEVTLEASEKLEELVDPIIDLLKLVITDEFEDEPEKEE